MSILKMRDLTTKAEVLETYAELFDVFDDNKEICKELCKVYDKIRGLPTIEPKRGKWIYLDGLDAFECSVCGRQMVRNIFYYCPWCGAKMERSEE